MNRLIIILFFVGFVCCQYIYAEGVKHITVTGKVTDNFGKVVPNVPVMDGRVVVVTDKKGYYELQTMSDKRFVYYTLPSGYIVDLQNSIPQFYKEIDPSESKQTVDFTINKSTVEQFAHNFIVWGDPQVYKEEEFVLLREVVDDVKQTMSISGKPFHAISVGDNIFDRHYLINEYKQTIGDMGIPFYHVIGNHDMNYNKRSNKDADKTYTNNFGPSHYAFNVGNVHYVVLNDVFYYGYTYRYIGYITEEQLSWLEQDLALIPKGKTVVISLHIPTMQHPYIKSKGFASKLSATVMNNKALYEIVKGYNVHIMAGHSHRQWNTQIKNHIVEHTHAAASGAWWQGPICTDGAPKGYTVYEVKGDSISWYFKGLGLSKEEQFRLYVKGDTVYANVFNYDECWKVHYYENGELKGEMERFTGVDPLSEVLYQPGKNKVHRWLSYKKTGHLFKHAINNTATGVKVVVTDRFGNCYEKQVSPYRLVWSDEFEKEGLPDSAKWNYDVEGNAWGWGNNESQFYTAEEKENAYVNNGTLKIIACKKQQGGKKYTSARLTTKGKGDWKYGKIVVRAKLPECAKGTWSAIWMLPSENIYGGWPKSGEIDIMESVGYACDSVYSTAHTEAYNHIKKNQKSGVWGTNTLLSDFHTYTLEWDEYSWRTYVDDNPVYEWKNEFKGWKSWPFDQKFHLILNLAVGGNWGGRHGIDDTKFPLLMEIDYVRVYQR